LEDFLAAGAELAAAAGAGVGTGAGALEPPKIMLRL
jgi:hypothetical protein